MDPASVAARQTPNGSRAPTRATTAMQHESTSQSQPTSIPQPPAPNPLFTDNADTATTTEPQLTRGTAPTQPVTTPAITAGASGRQEHRLSLIADDELATRHLIFDRESPSFAATVPAPASLQPFPTRPAIMMSDNPNTQPVNNRVPHQQPYPPPLFALPIPPPPPTLSIMANQQHPPPSMVAPAARGHGFELQQQQQQQQQQQPAPVASGLAFPSLSNLMPTTSESVNSNPTTLELAILANSAASQHFGMHQPQSLVHSTSQKAPPLAQQRARSRSLAQATTSSAPFTTRSDPVPGPNTGSASFLPSSTATAAFPTSGLITTPGMPAYPTRIAAHGDDSTTALAARSRSMSTPQLTSQDDLLGRSSTDQTLANDELQRLRTQQMQRAFGNSRSSPDPTRNRMSAASSSVSMTNRFSSSSTHNLVGDRIDRPVSASSMAAIPPRSPGFPASEHDAADESVGGQPPPQPSTLPPPTSAPTSVQPGWPLTATGEPSDYLTRVPVISSYTFHDFPSISHYTSGAIPFSRSSAITAPPVIVPINPQTFRLARNWAKTGDRPVAFHTLSETLAEMDDALDSVRRTGVRADPAVVSAHRLAVARAIKERMAGVNLGGGVDKIDALVDEVNAWMRKWDRVGVHAVVDWVLGVMTGWAHHLCMPLPGQADMDAFDDWLDNINEHWMHPRSLHMRNPFDNGLMFLELELLDPPAHALAANAPPP